MLRTERPPHHAILFKGDYEAVRPVLGRDVTRAELQELSQGTASPTDLYTREFVRRELRRVKAETQRLPHSHPDVNGLQLSSNQLRKIRKGVDPIDIINDFRNIQLAPQHAAHAMRLGSVDTRLDEPAPIPGGKHLLSANVPDRRPQNLAELQQVEGYGSSLPREIALYERAKEKAKEAHWQETIESRPQTIFQSLRKGIPVAVKAVKNYFSRLESKREGLHRPEIVRQRNLVPQMA